MKHKNVISWTAILATAGCLAAFVSFPWTTQKEFDSSAVIADALQRIKSHYVSEVDERALTGRTLAIVAGSLDRWSEFITSEEYQSFDEETEGRFGGIGVFFGKRKQNFIILNVLREGPAALAGLKSGDKLLRSGGIPLTGKTSRDVKRLIRGPPGTQVELTILRSIDSKQEKKSFKLTRRIIHHPSVFRVGILSKAPGIGVIRIARFQRDTVLELDQALENLEAEGIEGLILDMRSNPGGLYEEAVMVADRFLSQGVIVRTEGRNRSEEHVVRATDEDDYPSLPTAILVNGQTASAAELVAAALRDHERAVLVGEPTFGKCSVQTVYELLDQGRGFGALKITTKRYYPPGGYSFSEGGLEVDKHVPQTMDELSELMEKWQEELRENWNRPTAVLRNIDPQEGDVLNAGFNILSDPEAYKAALSGGRSNQSGEGSLGDPEKNDNSGN